jgi:hypothetical protein
MRILLCFLISVVFASCKNNAAPQAETAVAIPEAAENQDFSEDAAPPRETAQPDTFRLVISFISIGEGTDPEGPAKVDKVLRTWERKNGQAAYYSVQPWGREGEADYNFTLRGMTIEQQAEFVKLLQSALKDEKLILVTENKVNRFKR